MHADDAHIFDSNRLGHLTGMTLVEVGWVEPGKTCSTNYFNN